jgi:hypothetical protein
MNQDELDDWIATLLHTHSYQWRVIVQFLPGFSNEQRAARSLFLSRHNKIHKPPEIGI